jgi:hypothetical protein
LQKKTDNDEDTIEKDEDIAEMKENKAEKGD